MASGGLGYILHIPVFSRTDSVGNYQEPYKQHLSLYTISKCQSHTASSCARWFDIISWPTFLAK